MMTTNVRWGWFNNAPENICSNKLVADACFRGASLKVLSYDGDVAEVEYKGESDTVPSKNLLEREVPKFSWGDAVTITSKSMDARVVDVCWHFKEKCFYYYLEDLDGKPIKKRYFEDELQGV